MDSTDARDCWAMAFDAIKLGTASGVAAFLVVALCSQPARACQPPTGLVVVTTAVPADGVVIGVADFCGGCDITEVRLFTRDTHAAVAGTSRAPTRPPDSRRWFIFEPAQPLTAGTQYFVQEPDGPQTPQSTAEFTAVAATSDAPDVRHDLVVVPGALGAACRRYDEPPRGSCVPPPVLEGYSPRSVLRAELSVSARGPRASQLGWRLKLSADGMVVDDWMVWQVPGQTFSHKQLFRGTPARICSEVFALDLRSGTEERVSDTCFAVDAAQLGERDVPFGVLELSTCIEPAPEYFAQWCDAFASAIAARSCKDEPREPCAQALLRCPSPPTSVAGMAASAPPSAPSPPPSDSGAATSATVPPPPTSLAGMAGSAPPSIQAPPSTVSCATTSGTVPSRSGLARWLFMIGAAARVWRRRRAATLP